MSAEKLITELQDRGLISDRLIAKLRETVVESGRPLSASALAKFLVQKKHLSQSQAVNALRALTKRGIDVDAVGENVLASPANDDESDDEPEGSSIFAPFLTGAGKKTSGKSPRKQSDDEDELTLVSIDDEDTIISRKKVDSEVVDDDLPVLGALTTTKDPAPKARPVPPAADLRPKRDREESAPLTLTESDLVDREQADADELPSPRRTASLKRPGKGTSSKRKAKPTIRKKEWDSPLILYGGGGLALMILIGAAVAWFLTKEKGDLELIQARAARDSGAYGQAIEHYEGFLTNSPRHPEVSSARVQLAMVRIRQATESANYSAALELAEKELDAIEDEKEFNKAQAELTALLPQIALGLARQAEKAGAGAEEAKHLVDESKTALELCSNVAYIPEKQRDEGQLNDVREILNRVEYRELSHQALQETLTAMQQATDSGKTTAAYAAHKQLVKKHPEMAGNEKLAERIQNTTAAEQAAVKFVREELAAETIERPTPWVASLALAQRLGNVAAVTDASADVACVRVDGAVYGIDVADGSLRWRRHVGYASAAWPVLVDRDVLVTDARQHELLRLDAASGKLIWRQAIGEPFAAPLVVGGRAFLAAESGRLYVVDLASGARAGYLQFEQPLNVAPCVDRRQERLYLTGEHFSLYSISLADLTCLGVYYLGHDTGSIQFAPAQVLNKLAVVVNDGVETSRLHLLTIDDRGAVAGQATSQRLQGLAASPLMVEGRRLIVVTDRGRFDVYEIGAGQGSDALAQLATRPATDQQPIVRYVAVADGHIWVGDTQLTKYAILPTGDRLPVESIGNNFAGSAFDHPLEVFGNTLVHVRRPKGRGGFVVAATDVSNGSRLWETALAVPPAGSPIVDQTNKSLAIANANGYLFRFDEAAIRSRIVDEPLTARSMPSPLAALSVGVDLGAGRAAFFAPNSGQLLLYDPAKGQGEWIELESPLACAATPFGDGLLAPLKLGQVFYLDPASGKSLATPFQPKLQPRTTVEYQPAGAVDDRHFVITDGQEKIYLVSLVDQPQPHLYGIAEAKVSPYRIISPIVVVDDLAIAGTEGAHIVRFRLPALEPAGEADLPGEIAWGPFRVGDQVVLATADGKLVGLSDAGEIAWTEPLTHGDLAGPPLAADGGIVLAYRKGFIERRNMADGKPIAERNLEHPLASGPVQFLSRIVLAASDGTLLVVDQP